MLFRRLIQTTAALAAAVVAYTAITLPPKRVAIEAPLPPTAVAGAYHIHTTRSDGAGTPDEVAAAAAKAGLRFAILTDHGDATRPPDAPRYFQGVLMIDAVEISTVEGHVVALGLPGAAPYRLGGEARDVIEDIHRLGGFAIVAHPDSPRAELSWRNPEFGPGAPGRPARGRATGTDLAGADGLEWLNADSEWRGDSWPQLLNAVLHVPFRPAESFAQLFHRPETTLRRWDALTRRANVIGLSAVDAHGLVAGLYTSTFRSFAQAVILDGPLSGDAAADAQRVIAALRAGHAFSVITGLAGLALPQLTAGDNTRTVSIGERLTSPSGHVRIAASIPAALGARVVILHNGREVAAGMGRAEVPGDAEPGAYRLEAWLGAGQTPWIVTNPVYVDPTGAVPSPPPALPRTPAAGGPPASVVVPLAFGPEWTIERGPSSSGSVANASGGLVFEYSVGVKDPARDYVALARSMGDSTESFDRIEFTASASAPMRLFVEFRLPGGRDGERWSHSIYLDATPRPIIVRMASVTPVGFTATRRPIVARVKSILFVIDTLNTAPGSHGVIHLSGVRLVRSGDPAASGANGQQQVERPGQEQQVRRPGREGGR